MSETDKFIMEISTALNESGSFKAIQESSISNLGIELDRRKKKSTLIDTIRENLHGDS